MRRHLWKWIVGSSVLAAIPVGILGFRILFPSLQARTDRVQVEVSAIRGLPFRNHVEAGRESNAEFMAFVERQKKKHPFPPDYGLVVRTLGLYRGPVITDPEALQKQTLSAAAGGYYDFERRKFFMLREIPEPRLSAGLAHELYHAMQDQYFGVERYLRGERPDALDSDEKIARKAVMEGEATYVQFIYALQASNGRMPTHDLLGKFIRAQRESNHASVLVAIREEPGLERLVGKEKAAAMRLVEDLPPFMWDILAEPIQRGAEFIHSVHARGWAEVEKLYREYPPASSEQILHPEKWFAREEPVAIAWPAFEADPLWADWDVLGQDVLGEFQWRLVFRENGLSSEAASAAAGWGGDRYTVLRNRRNEEVLLLLYTSWDTGEDAREFASAYRRVLAAKYANEPTPFRVLEKDRDVIIVEGGEESDLASVMAFAERGREGPRT